MSHSPEEKSRKSAFCFCASSHYLPSLLLSLPLLPLLLSLQMDSQGVILPIDKCSHTLFRGKPSHAPERPIIPLQTNGPAESERGRLTDQKTPTKASRPSDQMYTWLRRSQDAGTSVRAIHSVQQVRVLEWVFLHHSRYPAGHTKRRLAEYLGMTYAQIQKWFQTRRGRGPPVSLSQHPLSEPDFADTIQEIEALIQSAHVQRAKELEPFNERKRKLMTVGEEEESVCPPPQRPKIDFSPVPIPSATAPMSSPTIQHFPSPAAQINPLPVYPERVQLPTYPPPPPFPPPITMVPPFHPPDDTNDDLRLPPFCELVRVACPLPPPPIPHCDPAPSTHCAISFPWSNTPFSRFHIHEDVSESIPSHPLSVTLQLAICRLSQHTLLCPLSSQWCEEELVRSRLFEVNFLIILNTNKWHRLKYLFLSYFRSIHIYIILLLTNISCVDAQTSVLSTQLSAPSLSSTTACLSLLSLLWVEEETHLTDDE